MNSALPRASLIPNCWSAPPPTGRPTARPWSAASAASIYRRYAAEVRGGATPATGAAAGRARGHPARQLRPGLRADAGAADGRLPARAAQSALYGAQLDFILRDAQPALLIADEASSALAAPLAAAQGIRLLDGATAPPGFHPTKRRRAMRRRRTRRRCCNTPAAPPASPGRHPEPGRHRHQCVPARSRAAHTRHGAETVLCAMPLFHSYGMAMGLFLAASAAATLVVLPRTGPTMCSMPWRAERVTLFPSPTIYAGLMAHARFTQTDWSSVRVCYSGSARWPRKRCGAGRRRWARRSMKATARPRPAPS